MDVVCDSIYYYIILHYHYYCTELQYSSKLISLCPPSSASSQIVAAILIDIDILFLVVAVAPIALASSFVPLIVFFGCARERDECRFPLGGGNTFHLLLSPCSCAIRRRSTRLGSVWRSPIMSRGSSTLPVVRLSYSYPSRV